MSSLQVQLSEKAKLIEEIANQFGEYEEGQLQKLEELDCTIPAKIDAWAEFLKEGIKEQIAVFKKKVDEYKNAIEKLEEYKEKKELYLNNLIKENGCGELIGEEKRIVPDLSVRRSVDMDKVERGYLNHTVVMSDKLNQHIMHLLGEEDLRTNSNEYTSEWETISRDCKHTCNVTSLPEDHPAIVKSIRQTVKILRNKGSK